jgi:hypothetical protein
MMAFPLRFRYLAVVAILFSIVNAVALIIVGIYKVFRAYQDILAGPSGLRGGRP